MIKQNGIEMIGVKHMGENVPIVVQNGEVLFYRHITDGLAQHYDGLNRGSNPLVWQDLQGVNDGSLELNVSFGTDSAIFNGGRIKFVGETSPEFVMMTVLSYSKAGTYSRIFGDPSFPSSYFQTAQDWRLRYYLMGNDVDFLPPTVLEENRRYHLCVRYKGLNNKAELFVNGIRVAETQNNMPLPQSTAFAYLGGNNTTTRFLTGEMCNFMRYERALTDEEIMQNYIVDKFRFNIP